jgi:hypothetical protein
MADLKYSEDALQERLKLARETERYKVWCDVFSMFTTPVRQHFANLMAHGYRVVAVEMQHQDGRMDFTATVAAKSELPAGMCPKKGMDCASIFAGKRCFKCPTKVTNGVPGGEVKHG